MWVYLYMCGYVEKYYILWFQSWGAQKTWVFTVRFGSIQAECLCHVTWQPSHHHVVPSHDTGGITSRGVSPEGVGQHGDSIRPSRLRRAGTNGNGAPLWVRHSQWLVGLQQVSGLCPHYVFKGLNSSKKLVNSAADSTRMEPVNFSSRKYLLVRKGGKLRSQVKLTNSATKTTEFLSTCNISAWGIPTDINIWASQIETILWHERGKLVPGLFGNPVRVFLVSDIFNGAGEFRKCRFVGPNPHRTRGATRTKIRMFSFDVACVQCEHSHSHR